MPIYRIDKTEKSTLNLQTQRIKRWRVQVRHFLFGICIYAAINNGSEKEHGIKSNNMGFGK